MPLVEFADEHWRVEDGGDATVLALLDLSVAFTISIFLDQLQGWEWEARFWVLLLLSPWPVSVGVGG